MVTAFGPEANNTINMFFVNSIGGGNIGGYAYLPNFPVSTNRILIDRNYMINDNGQVIVHEVGHWLSLNHTFEGTEQGPNDPNVELHHKLIVPLMAMNYATHLMTLALMEVM